MLSECVINAYATPPSMWDSLVSEPVCDGHGNGSGRSDEEWGAIADNLEGAAVRMLLLAEYISCRRGRHCVDHKSHALAAKYVAKRHVALRRVLGFKYPKEGVLQL